MGGLTLSALTACNPAEDTATTSQEEAVAIKVFNLRHQEVTDYGEWFGYLRGEQDTDIHPRITGFLVSQEYKDGTRVKAGDVLFRIDPKLFEAALQSAQANLQAAEASLTAAEATAAKAELDVKRYTQLVQSGSVSEKDLTDAQQTYRAAKAQVEAAKAQIGQQQAAMDKAQINLDYTVIRAPYDGIVGNANVSIGDLVSPATKLANIISIDPIRVDFSINGDHLLKTFRQYGMVSTNSKDAPKPPSFHLLMEDGSELPYKGTMVAMDSVLTSTGLANIEGLVPNPDGVLRGGMPVRVKVPLNSGMTFLVPKVAIRTVLLNTFIIVVDKAGVPHMIPVNVGGEYPIRVEEANGYHSTQTMVSVKDYGTHSIAEQLKKMGYENPEEALIVTDAENAIRAVTISAENSRLPKDAKPATIKTEQFTFKPAPNPAIAAAEKKAEGAEEPAVEKKDIKPGPAYPVKVSKMLQQDVSETATWFGSLRGVDETDIRAQVSGFIMKQHFADGTLVKKGDVLFTIDQASYEATLNEARANLVAAKASKEQAEAQLTMSRTNLERYRKLIATTPGAISDKVVTDTETQVSTNEAAVRKAEATIAQMQAAVNQAEINLGYTTITAPFDGRIGIHKVSVGSLVSPSDVTPLVTLSSVNPIRVDFGMSGRGAIQGFTNYRVRKADPRTATPAEFEIILDDNQLYPKKGQIITANNTLSTSTGTLDVIGHVENEDGLLRSGMAVTVRAKLKPILNACLVPARAPLNANGMDLIVLLKPDNTPQMLPITKGPMINLKLDNGDGKEYLQPMQVVEPSRSLVTGMMLAKTKAQNLESIVLGGAKVQSWAELYLKKSGAADFRALYDMITGETAADDAPAKAGVANWEALVLRRMAAQDFRELVLRAANAKDELDLIAYGQGCKSLMDMVVQGMGFKSATDVSVVVEGSIQAAQTYAANEAAGAPINKLTPQPFIYIPTKTVTPSITADPIKVETQYE